MLCRNLRAVHKDWLKVDIYDDPFGYGCCCCIALLNSRLGFTVLVLVFIIFMI
jgi:hypothetical protein